MITEERRSQLNKMVEEEAFKLETYKELTMEEAYYVFAQAGRRSFAYKPGDKRSEKYKIKANFFYTLTIEKLKEQEAFYVIFYAVSNMPYVSCHEKTADDMVMVYTEEEDVKAAVKRMMDQKFAVSAVKVEKAHYLTFFSTLFYNGINAIWVNPNKEQILIQVDKICKKPDWKKMENQAAAVANPELQLTMMYFMQEFPARSKSKDPAVLKGLLELEEEMIANMIRGTYLVPVIGIPGGKEDLQIPYLKNKKEEIYIPVFSDLNEFRKYNPESKYNAAIMPFEKVAASVTGMLSGFVVNAMGNNLTVNKKKLEEIVKRFKLELPVAQKEEKEAKED